MPRAPTRSRTVDRAKPEAAAENHIFCGDSAELIKTLRPGSIALSVWSPPYFVGKSYERGVSFEQWEHLLRRVISGHQGCLKPGGFLAVNIADILCYADPSIPKIQAENIASKNRLPVSRDDIARTARKNPGLNRYQLAELLGVSEQTIDRRLNNNNIRGGKHATQTRVKLVGSIIEEAAYSAGLYLYDRRVWAKDPCWENSKWHTNSYRAVDEFEYLYIFWKPGITKVDRNRLTREEWSQWGSRAVWSIPSVRSNDDHEAKFPVELPLRCIRLFTDPGDTVLDCFMGSGTTAIAAIQSDRHSIGFELMPEYVKLCRENIRKAKGLKASDITLRR